MADIQSITFIDNPAAGHGQSAYISVTVDTALVFESWRSSLFSFEWLNANGSIKNLDQLPAHEQPKRKTVEDKIREHAPLEKPVLGIGIMDNIEIGAGRAEFLTLMAYGARKIPVHIPKSCESDFKAFIVAVSS
jgi:hypothetical protein